MRLSPACAVLLLAVYTAPVIGFDDPPEIPEDVARFTTHYYIDKDVDRVAGWLKALQQSRLLETHDSASVPITAFLAVVLTENPARVGDIATAATFTGNTKTAVQRAMWVSGNGGRIGEFFHETPDFARAKPVRLKKRPIKEPGDLDMMWGAFLASGDAAYVKRIIDVLDEKHPLSGEKALDEGTRGAAEWSLRSNMVQHELVYRLVCREAKSRKGAVGRKLRKMVTWAKPASSLPNKDGEFSAMLVLMAEQDLKEFEKPSDSRIRLRELSETTRGEVVAIKVMFSGLKLTKELDGAVEYDLKILTPDGKIYDDTDLKGLQALSRKVPTRFRVFNNENVVMIRFEAKDKAGTYRVVAQVRDKIGGKSVDLEGKITLKDE
jgi:hypothetical protein